MQANFLEPVRPPSFIHETYLEFADKFGVEGLLVLIFALFVMTLLGSVIALLFYQMKSEINRVTADNRIYRDVYFRRLIGMSNEEIALITAPNDGRTSRGGIWGRAKRALFG